MAISGTGVAIATIGGVLVYAGLTKQNPLAAMRSIGSGKPTPVSATSSFQNTGAVGAATGSAAAAGLAAVNALVAGGGLPQLVPAAEQFAGDQYSQANRWAPGFSDCSSFVGKALKAIGITPPGASVTGSYLTWSKLAQIPASQVGAGDLICNATHIIIAVNNTTGIGQENPRRNVRVGPISELMAGTGSYVALRYIG